MDSSWLLGPGKFILLLTSNGAVLEKTPFQFCEKCAAQAASAFGRHLPAAVRRLAPVDRWTDRQTDRHTGQLQ